MTDFATSALGWIGSNVAALAAIGAAIAFGWSAIQFVLTRRDQQRVVEFEHYHLLIKELVSPDSETSTTWVDRQIAVVFELRHFPRYFEVTARILGALKSHWGQPDSPPAHQRLLDEIDLTLEYVARKT